ncbi:hypothetical protein [Amycolatopsis anabasis]|nr:hypothetical protein [Amycolatopsis anabasis]
MARCASPEVSVLVVDDEPAVRAALTVHGYLVSGAARASSARA